MKNAPLRSRVTKPTSAAITCQPPTRESSWSYERKPTCQPPKKIVEQRQERTNIETYSPRKKAANLAELNSVWKPATSSLSPSARSKGARLVSANMQIRKSRKLNGALKMPHCQKYDCCWTIVLRSSV